MSKTMPLRPRLSEKAMAQSQQSGTYVFVVPTDATKHTVANAVAAQFEVIVKEVNMNILKGKAKRTVSQKGRRVMKGRTVDMKKAYVTLAAGQTLPIFDAIQEEEAKEQATQEKMTKVMEKQAEKEAKQEAKPRRGLRRAKKEDA